MNRSRPAVISWAATTRCVTTKLRFTRPGLSNSENVESWEEAGSKDMRQRAYERWNEMLNLYETPQLDIAKYEELAAYVTRRKEQLPDAWY